MMSVNKFIIIIVYVLFGCFAPEEDSTQDYTTLVNTFIGTGGHGHTYPGATLPFGMVQLSPDTRLEGWDGCSGYHDSDSIIYGFSHTHLSGTGVSDYGDILLMPSSSKTNYSSFLEKKDYDFYLSFSKKTELASPGYYSVHLNDANIDVSLTCTKRVVIHQYVFHSNSQHAVIIDINHRDKLVKSYLRVVNDSAIEGFRQSSAWASDQRIFFTAVFSQPFNIPPTGVSLNDSSTRFCHLVFNLKKEDTLIVKVGISASDIEHSKMNLTEEAPHNDFEKYKKNAHDLWQQELSKIEIKGGTKDQQIIFYSALYHTMIVPNVFNDVDGTYRGMDGSLHQTQNQDIYTVFSLWDTYRDAHPLYTIIEQKRTSDFINTFLKQYEQSGLLHVWELAGNETNCMIGYHAVSVIADAMSKGIKGFDQEEALTAALKSSKQNKYGIDSFHKQGYIASNNSRESVSKTLEYAYDDWCIATIAEKLNQLDIANEYYRYAGYYCNLFNSKTEMMQPRSNGGWLQNFIPEEVNFNFTEANSWQYSAMVPHDINGLIILQGGKKGMERWLDSLFNVSSATLGREQADITGLIGQYAHGNEPSHHLAYLYNFTGNPNKTQQSVHQILTTLYSNKPDGLCGNEDCGQMSAWFVLSAMGFYHVAPGKPEYIIGSPLFDKVTIHMENGNDIVISSHHNSQNDYYIMKVTLNGKDYPFSYINQQVLNNGGKLDFQMSDNKDETWSVSDKYLPTSLLPNTPKPVPLISASSPTFTDSLVVTITSKGKFSYSIKDNADSTLYEGQDSAQIILKKNTYIAAWNSPEIVRAQFSKLVHGRTIVLDCTYDNQYNGGGNMALIDGLRGGNDFRTGRWQGFKGKDVTAVIDLGKKQKVIKIRIGSIQDIGSWNQ